MGQPPCCCTLACSIPVTAPQDCLIACTPTPPHLLPLQAGGEDAARLGPAALRALPAPAPAAQANHHIRRVRRSSWCVYMCGDPRIALACCACPPSTYPFPSRPLLYMQAEPAACSWQQEWQPSLLLPPAVLQWLQGHREPQRLECCPGSGCCICPAQQINHPCTAAFAAAAAGAGWGGPAAGRRSIVFHRRSAHSRQLANLQELVDRCSQWGWAAAAAGQGRSSTQQGAGGATQSRLSCSSHLFGDVPASVAAAQAADVFIGTHGANLANSERQPLVSPCCSAPGGLGSAQLALPRAGFFMQPGSAMVEVIHPGWARIVHMLGAAWCWF